MPTKPLGRCRVCGGIVPPEAPFGLCPRCVLAASLTPLERPSDAEVAEADRPASVAPVDREKGYFGDYELLEEIGRGGMGIVYKARQRSLNRMVALKMVIPSRLTSAADLRRFQFEAETAGRLDHAHILPIYDVGEVSGQPFYTMKWVEGGSLAAAAFGRQRTEDGGRKTDTSDDQGPASAWERQAAVANLLVKIARAVAYAHERGLLHRDLKPGNILLDAHGEPYVADFGLAKLMEKDQDLVQSMPTVGTPGYAAPEQLQGGSQHATMAADVYSLGAVLYELLTGKAPFRGPTPVETIRQALDSAVKSPHSLNPAVDRDLETICLKCLQKEPKRRYPSAADLADDLERWLTSRPIQARPVGWVERSWLWCQRKPALAALAVALVITLAASSALAAWRIGVAREKERREAYYALVALADKFIQDGSTDRAMQLLSQCPAELRHWEWGYLAAQCHQELLTIPAHTNRTPGHFQSCIRNLAFDATGERLITCGFDGQIRVWDSSTGRPLRSLRVTNLFATSWVLHPAKPEMAVGTTDGAVFRFDLSQGRELPAVPPGLPDAAYETGFGETNRNITSVAYAPDGESLAVATASGVISLRDLKSGRPVWRIPLSVESPRVFISTDGKEVIVQDRLAAWWLNASTGDARTSRRLDPLQFSSLNISPDGATQVTISAMDEVELVRPGTGPCPLGAIFTADSGLERRVIFSRDGQRFCTTGAGGTAKVFDVASGTDVLSLQDPVFSAVFSPEGTRLVSLRADRQVQIWDLNRRAKAMTLRGHLMIVDCAAFTIDGRRVATADRDGFVKIWSGLPGRTALPLGEWPRLIKCAPDGRNIAASAYYDRLKVWNLDSGRIIRTLRARYDKTYALDFSPDGRSLATVALDPFVRLWDVSSGRLLEAFRASTNYALRAVRFSPDGHALATADSAGTVKLWDLASRSNRLSLTAAGTNLWDIEFSRGSDHAVISGINGPPLVWNLRSGRIEHVLAETHGAWSSRFSPDGRTLVLAGLDGILRIYETGSWDLKASHKSRGRGTGWMDFTPDGRRLAMPVADGGTFGQDSGAIQIWDAEHWRELIAIDGPADAFFGAWFTTNYPCRLLTANGDRMIYQLEAFPWRNADYRSPPKTDLAHAIGSYAAQYWQRRLRQEQEQTTVDEPANQPSPLIDDLVLSPRSPRCEPRMIDLGPHYNLRLDAWLHPDTRDELGDFSLAAFLSAYPSGWVELLGVLFDARGVLLTRRYAPEGGVLRTIWERLPAKVEGIQVHQCARRLHVLHATCPEDAVPEGTVVGIYVWHFADGTAHEQPITYGQDLRSWWWMPNKERPADLARGRIAWIGDTPRAAESGARIRLYLATYANPRPDLEISQIDFVSNATPAAPFLVAITVEP
ncbi:MAG: protein kinase [Verrucomicrobiia bacterium]